MPIDSGGRDYRTPISAGYADSDLLMGPAYSMIGAPSGTQDDAPLAMPTATLSAPKGSPTMWLVGLVGLAVAMHFIHREARRKAGKPIGEIEDAIGINVWNLLNVTILASVGILTLKVGANKWAPGTTFASVATAI